MKTLVEDTITSLRTITVAMLLYIAGYALKLTILFNGMLITVMPNFYMRTVTSFFTGFALSMGLLIVSINNHKKYLPYVLACMDAFALLIVFKVFHLTNFTEVLTTIFISCFMAFVGYQLITVFVSKYQQVKSGFEQSLSELKTKISELSTNVSERKRDLADVERQISESKRYTCKKCGREFGSKNALNAHKCKK